MIELYKRKYYYWIELKTVWQKSPAVYTYAGLHNVCYFNDSTCICEMSRYTKIPTLWTLRKCIDPDQTAQSAQVNPDRHIPSQWDRGIEDFFLKQKFHRRQKVSFRVSLRGMLMLIRIDTLRRVHKGPCYLLQVFSGLIWEACWIWTTRRGGPYLQR